MGQSEAAKPFPVKIVQSAGSLIRPLPPHSVHRAGYIFRPGCVGCFTSQRPVPLQASHLRSGENGPLIEILLAPHNTVPIVAALSTKSRPRSNHAGAGAKLAQPRLGLARRWRPFDFPRKASTS